jgi:hypothetical protein
MFAMTAPIPEPIPTREQQSRYQWPNFNEERYRLHGWYHRRGTKRHQGVSSVESHYGSQGKARDDD